MVGIQEWFHWGIVDGHIRVGRIDLADIILYNQSHVSFWRSGGRCRCRQRGRWVVSRYPTTTSFPRRGLLWSVVAVCFVKTKYLSSERDRIGSWKLETGIWNPFPLPNWFSRPRKIITRHEEPISTKWRFPASRVQATQNCVFGMKAFLCRRYRRKCHKSGAGYDECGNEDELYHSYPHSA